jgi:alcohol dehydrogenase class IV
MSDSSHIADLCGNWNYPTTIRFGVGRINELVDTCVQLNIGKPLLVTDQGLASLPIIDNIKQLFTNSQMPCALFCDVKPNPTGSNIDSGVAIYRHGDHDGVIAIGGGSGLDAGKAIALMVGQDRPIWDFEDVGDNWQRVSELGMAPIIAIPTTAGTGSEVGRASVIVDEQQRNKKIIFHPKMLPAVVIADPALTCALPAHITAATGMDAFVHNLEAYCAPGYHPMADGIALEGMRLIKNWLVKAYEDGSNQAARSHMMVASSMGATAFQKGLGGVHALAHPLGAHYDAHHGLLNAILLPYVLEHNRPVIEDKIAEIAYQLRLPDISFECFMNWLTVFAEQLNIPRTLRDIGIDAEQAQLIGEQAVLDPSAAGNPVKLSAAQYAEIFINAVEGKHT